GSRKEFGVQVVRQHVAQPERIFLIYPTRCWRWLWRSRTKGCPSITRGVVPFGARPPARRAVASDRPAPARDLGGDAVYLHVETAGAVALVWQRGNVLDSRRAP